MSFPYHGTYKLLGDIRLFANLQRRDKYNKVPPGVRGIRSLAYATDQQMLLCAGYEVEAFGWDIRTQSMVSFELPIGILKEVKNRSERARGRREEAHLSASFHTVMCVS